MQLIHQRVGRSKLAAELAAYCGIEPAEAPEIRVFPCGDDEASWNERVGSLGEQAAGFLRELLIRSELCGVTWGRHVASAVAGLEALAIPAPWRDPPGRVIPLCGDSTLRPLPSHQGSASLAARLNRIVNGAHETVSLAAVPAFIPMDFSEEKVKVVQELIDRFPAYVEIFGPHKKRSRSNPLKPLLDQVSMILTGVGPAVRQSKQAGEYYKAAGLDLERLSRMIIGDVSAYFIAKPILKLAEREEVKQINRRFTGLHGNDLVRCAKAARASGGALPGVVIVAAGEDRAEILVEIARLKLSNVWIIDNTLERKLSEIIDAGTAHSTIAGERG